MNVRVAAGLLLLVAGLLAGCGTARRGIPVVPGEREITDPELLRGRQLFYANCHQCHPGGAAGLGPTINNKPLPGWLIEFQVRNGLGAMPSIPEEWLSDEELDELVDYLEWLRDLDPDSEP